MAAAAGLSFATPQYLADSGGLGGSSAGENGVHSEQQQQQQQMALQQAAAQVPPFSPRIFR